MLKIPHFLDSLFTNSLKVLSPTRRPRFTPQKTWKSRILKVFIILKWTVSRGRKREILIDKHAHVNGHIPFTKNPDLMFFGVNAFGSSWFAMDGMS
jgi:hypothetical protein